MGKSRYIWRCGEYDVFRDVGELWLTVFREIRRAMGAVYNIQADNGFLGKLKKKLNGRSGLVGKYCIETAKSVKEIVIQGYKKWAIQQLSH